jgi:Cft2 family RNA processing exonuclease
VHATRATVDLLGILLPDSGHRQEEEAAYHNKHGTSKHTPALPLHTAEDGRRAAQRVRGAAYGEVVKLAPTLSTSFARAGHSLGSAIVRFALEQSGRLPRLPMFIDSPMAIDATEVYCAHPEDFDGEMRDLVVNRRCPLHRVDFQLARTADESKAINMRAHVEVVYGLSAHADSDGLMRWRRTSTRPPKRVFVVHGDPGPAAALAGRVPTSSVGT